MALAKSLSKLGDVSWNTTKNTWRNMIVKWRRRQSINKETCMFAPSNKVRAVSTKYFSFYFEKKRIVDIIFPNL